MGGWDEEAWYARLQKARCLRKLGDEGGFLREAIAAFNQRPHRAEPLHDLARFYRERGMNDASVLFSEQGLALPFPKTDTLFIEESIYTYGLKEEFSIAANYARDPKRKDRGFEACNWLALNRDIDEGSRELAWSNLHFYVYSADVLMPTFAVRPFSFAAPEGYRATNPSVTTLGGQIVLVLRAVNYVMTEEGLNYQIPNGAPITTRNFLLRLTSELHVATVREILPPADFPEPACKDILGFEDMRLFTWRGALWSSSCVRSLTREAWCEQVLARIDDNGLGPCRLADWRTLAPPGERRHEKNWMPRVEGDTLCFVYRCDPTRIIDDQARTVFEEVPAVAAQRFRGGSQVIAFDGGWLALVHEVEERSQQRYYRHRFVWFDVGSRLRAVSRPFFFQKKGIEFAAGLTWHSDAKRLVVSYGVADNEACIATVDAEKVRNLLEDVERQQISLFPKRGGAENGAPRE
jgi:predicted GH43/DUF377 family glycosyl hydrolase